MEKYSHVSYEPHRVEMSSRGYLGLDGEPRSLLRTPIEQNILVLAYEKPLSPRRIADAIGIPCAYLEPIIDTLVRGELMGETSSGLVYTRCLLLNANELYGDIPAQEALADRMAEQIWQVVLRHFGPLMQRESFCALSDKQKATLLLSVLYQALFLTTDHSNPCPYPSYDKFPERPNGGKWYAVGFVLSTDEQEHPIYRFSGPRQYTRWGAQGQTALCQMLDCQSVFGDTAEAYRRFKYHLTTDRILAFYESLLPGGPPVSDSRIYEMIPYFEKMHVVGRDRDGALCLTIPAMRLEEMEQYWYPAVSATAEALQKVLGEELASIARANKHRVPHHVDGRRYQEYASSLYVYPTAQLLSLVHRGYLPYRITVGETPLIYIAYK